MVSKIDIAQAVEFLKQALPEMSKRSIPTTPQNYAVWYEFVAGKNAELVREINALIKANREFDPELNDHLYEKHIASSDSTQVDQIRESVREIINDLLGKMAQEGTGLSDYSQSLHKFSHELEQSEDVSAIQILVKELVEETRQREDANASLQATLQDMTHEIQSLRQQVEKLNLEATTDALTRIKNRRAFDLSMEQAISQAKTDASALSMILLDIDYFKKFNDTHGHAIGDKVLRFTAAMLTRLVKGQDIVARFGGEEFAIILPQTAYENAMKLAENIRASIAAQALTDSEANLRLGGITVSCGVALYEYGEEAADLVERADNALYLAKDCGRDQVKGERDLTPAQPA